MAKIVLGLGVLLTLIGTVGYYWADGKASDKVLSVQRGGGVTATTSTRGQSEYAPLVTTMRVCTGGGLMMVLGGIMGIMGIVFGKRPKD